MRSTTICNPAALQIPALAVHNAVKSMRILLFAVAVLVFAGPAFAADDHGNGIASATPVANVGGVAVRLSGKLEESADLDVFRLVLPATRKLALYGTSRDLAVAGRLLDASGNQLLNGTKGITFELVNNELVPVSYFEIFGERPAGTYHLEVSGPKAGAYQLALMAYEDDHGDDEASATPIAIASNEAVGEVAGRFDADVDADYFTFTLTATMQVRIESVSALDPEADLIPDPDNAVQPADDVIEGSDISDDEYDFRIIKTLPPGVYYLKVHELDSAVGNYVLRVSAKAPGSDDHGNTRDTATPVALGASGGSASGLLGESGDVDYFVFTLPVRQRVRIRTPDQVVFLELRDGTGAYIASDQLIERNLDPGTYFVAVDAVEDPPWNYALQLSLSQATTASGYDENDGAEFDGGGGGGLGPVWLLFLGALAAWRRAVWQCGQRVAGVCTGVMGLTQPHPWTCAGTPFPVRASAGISRSASNRDMGQPR